MTYTGTHARHATGDGVCWCALMPPRTRSQRSQRQPETQSRNEYAYAWSSDSISAVLIFIYFYSDSDWTSQLVATRAELATLQARYDDLRADRDRLAQTLSERMKIWRRFKQRMAASKGKVPPKPTERDELRPCSCGSSTPGLQQQPVTKMLETPMTPTSLCPLSFFVSVQCTFC